MGRGGRGGMLTVVLHCDISFNSPSIHVLNLPTIFEISANDFDELQGFVIDWDEVLCFCGGVRGRI